MDVEGVGVGMERGQAAVLTVVVVGTLLVGAAIAMGGAESSYRPPPRVPDDATRIDSCTTISEPGAYVLTTDLKDNKKTRLSESCIRIVADDVIFSGGGHVVDGKGISDTRGVTANGTNVTVVNVVVSDWNRGVYFRNVSDGEVRNVTASGNAYGIDLDGTSGVAVVNNDVSSNLIGIDLTRSNEDVDLRGNDADGNHVADVYRNETG